MKFYRDEPKYVGNVDINHRPVIRNDDGSYSTTGTAFQERWHGPEDTGSYRIGHFATLDKNGWIPDDELNPYVDQMLSADDPMAFDSPENGGRGILYRVDTDVGGQPITDQNLQQAFDAAERWDVNMHNRQDAIYRRPPYAFTR